MAGVLSQNSSHVRAGDGEAKRTVFLCSTIKSCICMVCWPKPALFSETVMHLVRKKVLAFQEVEEESLSEIAAPESLNVKKPSLLSMSCTGYCKESVRWKKHCSVHICLGGHSGRGRRKGRRNKSADDLRKVKAELVNFCPLKWPKRGGFSCAIRLPCAEYMCIHIYSSEPNKCSYGYPRKHWHWICCDLWWIETLLIP